MQLPAELQQQQRETQQEVAGGRRNNPRGKRVWPLAPTPRHRKALRRTLESAAAESPGGRLVELELSERYGVATFESERTARGACDRLETMEVEWTAAQRSTIGGGAGATTLDAAGRCVVDYRPAFLEPQRAESLQQELLDATAWVGVKPQLPQGSRQPRQVCYMADDPSMSYEYGGECWVPHAWSAPALALKEAVESATGHRFNSVLLNLYRDGAPQPHRSACCPGDRCGICAQALTTCRGTPTTSLCTAIWTTARSPASRSARRGCSSCAKRLRRAAPLPRELWLAVRHTDLSSPFWASHFRVGLTLVVHRRAALEVQARPW